MSAAEGSSLLDRTAAAFAIEPGYEDAGGLPRTTTPAAKRALLAAMGVETGSAEGLRAALDRAEAAALVPAVLATRAGEDASLPLPLGAGAPPGAAGGARGWRLALEDGETLEGALPAGGDRLTLPTPLPPGYHRLLLERSGADPASILLVASPGRCLTPGDLGTAPCFGIACQVQSLRGGGGGAEGRSRDLGSGDLADLAALAEAAGREGADLLGVNPLHALFLSTPAARSPYSPSSRSFLNWLLVAPDLVPEVADDPGLARGLAAAQEETRTSSDHALVDHPATAARRRRLLEAGFARFRETHLGGRPTPRGRAFLDFRRDGGEALARHCLFEALQERFLADDRGPRRRFAWRDWPAAYRDPSGSEVLAFARDRADDDGLLAFPAWLQWLADDQLRAAHERGRAAGMRLGLYRDLAVGVDPAGSAAWSWQGALAGGATVGAPPDLFNPLGQDWGLAPFSPVALEAAGFAPWIADIRANMRHAGALRVDHVLGLGRLYWVPAGAGPADGAYVRYPFATMAAILTLESHRHRCLVVGEDLGTVPPGFRPALERAGIMGCRVLYFEQDEDGLPTPPDDYPPLAAASVGTHDLAPLRGWLEGTDLGWRERLGLFPTDASAAAARKLRAGDRDRLLAALRDAGLLDAGDGDDPETEAVALAAHRWLARTPSALLLVQLEDLALQAEAVNLPGTLDEHPNWRRRLGGVALEDLLEAPFARRLLAALREERPRG